MEVLFQWESEAQGERKHEGEASVWELKAW
jgi:hypothetical protein